MKKELLLLTTLLAGGVCAKAERPNIVIFLADDMGYADAGFTGATDINTPNIDQLASEGVVFSQGYVSHPFSAPSRAGLLSGRYQQRFGFETNPSYDIYNPHMGLHDGVKLFPERLQEVGYTTGIIGKWHLGGNAKHHPNNHGFDYFYGFTGGAHDFFEVDLTQDDEYKQYLLRNEKPAAFEGYITNAFTEDAVNFVNENKDNPFMLYLAYNAPHEPLQAPEEDIARYSNIEDPSRRIYAAMVDVMDRGIGQVVDALKENGLYENTLIFFLSDNGGPLDPVYGNSSCNGEFRDGKGSMYEGGIHVPFVACWPEKLKPSQYDYPVNSLDISRTIVDVTGADAESGQTMDGTNLVPYITGQNQSAPHEALFWRCTYARAMVTVDGMKQVAVGKRDAEVYDLNKDVSEQTDVTAQIPEKAAQMQQMWDEWNKDNIPNYMAGYKVYYKERDQFYEDSRPDTTK